MTISYFHRDADARVLLFSLRNLRPSPSRCVNFEMEDVVCSLERADGLAPLRSCGPPTLVQRALWGRIGRRLSLGGAAPRLLGPAPLDRDYDLLFITCQNPSDLYCLGPLGPWRARCRRAIVYVDELWAHTVPSRAGELAMLAQFDHIFAGQEQSAAAIEAATGVPTTYLAVGVDTLRFCPYPQARPRVIDVFNMGRRSPVTHAALKALADERGLLYLYDTVSGMAPVYDVRDHRLQLANMIKRSRYFITNVAKITAPEDTGGQQEVGFRFYEGAAAGAVLVGEPPTCRSFDQHFGWEDSVVRMPYGTGEPGLTLDALEADPARVEAIRRRNVAQSLLRHDWAYRWSAILEVAGLQATPRVGARIDQLAQLASDVEGGGVVAARNNGHGAALPRRRAAG